MLKRLSLSVVIFVALTFGNPWSKTVSVSGYTTVPPLNKNRHDEAVATHGPLVISISGENRDFQMFRGGFISNSNSKQNSDSNI